MSDAQERRFVMRDRNWHPKALTPDYKTSVGRSPRQALVSIPQSISETSGPDFTHLKMGQHDNDLLLNFNTGALPIGERIIVHGRVVDQFGKPIPHTLVEMWQANAGGRYRHKNDRYLAPLDVAGSLIPHKSGVVKRRRRVGAGGAVNGTRAARVGPRCAGGRGSIRTTDRRTAARPA